MQKQNIQIRRAARVAGVPLWAVAASIGISEPTLMRWLRFPLSLEREVKILAAIDDLAKEAD